MKRRFYSGRVAISSNALLASISMHDQTLNQDLLAIGAQAAQRRRTLKLISAGGLASFLSSGLLAQTATSNLDTVLNYAEKAYPAFFPGPQSNRISGTLTYRYYPTTNNYVGVSNERVYVMGPLLGQQPVDVGSVAQYVSIANGTTNASSCSLIPEETAGPYPGDGSNGLGGNSGIINALSLSGIVRSDIRTSIGGATGTASGVPLTVKLNLVNTASNCSALSGYAIYLWHCTRDGLYSLYSSGVTDQNYLRGVQVTDNAGQVQFTTVFPGCYAGRVPHIHFEVYPSLTKATGSTSKVKTSQLAFPMDTCQSIYQVADGYSSSVRNLAQISLATDNVFSDGYIQQMSTLTGDATHGYTASLQVGIAA